MSDVLTQYYNCTSFSSIAHISQENLICVNIIEMIPQCIQLSVICVHEKIVDSLLMLYKQQDGEFFNELRIWTSIWRENDGCQISQPQIQIIYILRDVFLVVINHLEILYHVAEIMLYTRNFKEYVL